MWNKAGKWSTTLFFVTVLVLPMAGLMIMDDQLTDANSITGAAAVNVSSGDTQIFAGMLMILIVIGGLVSLLFSFHSKVKAKKRAKAESKDIDNLSEEIKKL